MSILLDSLSRSIIAEVKKITISQLSNSIELRPRLIRSAGRCLAARLLCYLALVVFAAMCGAQNVTTWHVDNARTGVQQNESILNPGNVSASTFGKVFKFPVSGAVYAEPLYVSQYQMGDGQLHNVLVVATAEDNVYAFDADGNNPSQGYLWHKSMLGPGETWVSYKDVNVVDIKPNIGIIGTPVIDPVAGVIYLVAKSKTVSSPVKFYQRLHALNLADGSEALNGPTVIAATVTGTASGGTTLTFSPLLENQRSALLLAPTPSGPSGSSVFMNWGSHGDLGAYHGWVMSYDAGDISQQTGAWSSTPNGAKGGTWMSGGGPSSDDAGNIYLGVGNGTFDADSGGSDYGDSALHLTLGGNGLAVADSFTPSDQAKLFRGDADMGMSAPVLLPPQSGSIPNLGVTADKSGTIYLLNLNKMGNYLTTHDTSVQDFTTPEDQNIHASFAFYNNAIYLAPDKGHLEVWNFDPASESFSTTPSSQSLTALGCSSCAPSGSTPSISANNGTNGIVWALDNGYYNNKPGILHAYDANNLASELYNSAQAANGRDTGTIAVKYTTPTIANGRVYVGGLNGVTAYGLLNNGQSQAATPTFSPQAGTYPGAQNVQIQDSTPNASIYYTTDGSTPSTNSTPYTAAISVANSETINAIATAPGYSTSAVAQAEYLIASNPPPNQVEVSLTPAVNLMGVATDGMAFTAASLNGSGCDYSANLLGNPVQYAGIDYLIGSPNQKNVVKGGSSSVIPLTSGNYSTLNLLAVAVGKSQATPQALTVTYSDESTATFNQSVSTWLTPKKYAGESIALKMSYCDTKSGGQSSGSHYLYQYTFPLDSTRTVTSLTLPDNPNVVVVAATLGSPNP